ncbi:MAG: methyltransferase domain-containing protein [Chloroflexota bacterium]
MKPSRLESNVEWRQWGETDPLWNVATRDGRRRGEANAWTDDAFYALGRSDWADFLRRWERYGVDEKSCVEVGCGAGRITGPMTEYFDAVHGLDVSEGMLAYARQRVPKANFYLTDGVEIPLADASVTAAFSTHVFQHLDTALQSVPIFRELHRVLAPGGTLMIHLPLYTFPFAKKQFATFYRTRGWLAQQRARLRRLVGRPIMRRVWYETDWLYGTLASLGFTDIEFAIFPTSLEKVLHEFVLARR